MSWRGQSTGAVLPRLLITSPDLVAVAFGGFSVGPMILLLADHFSMAPVLVTGIVGAVGAVWMRGIDIELPERRAVVCTVVALVLVAGWLLVNARYTAQSVYSVRDPVTYNITARWLMDHPSLHIATHPEIFNTPSCSSAQPPPCAYNGSAGFKPVNTTQVYAQGNHLFPAYAALAGWLFGVQGLFHANLVLGGCALLVFFGLVRRVAGAPLALLAMSAMAVSVPMIYVSRDTFSEPLTMLFLTGALGLLHRGINSNRVRDFLLAGLVAGSSAMVRVDSYGALLTIILAATVIVGVADAGRRRQAVLRGVALLGACVVPATLGWLDVTWLSSGYYHDQRGNILLEIVVAALALVGGVVAVAVLWLPRARSWLSAKRTRHRVLAVMISAVVLVFVVMLSRPLWEQTHGPVNNPVLALWQAEAHVAVDGTRTYNETALREVGAYFGWVTVVLAVIGYAALLHSMILRRDYALVGILGMGLTMSGFYLWDWQIVADQPWAMRRFVPVVLPELLLAAAVALRRLRRLWGGGWAVRGVPGSGVPGSGVPGSGVPARGGAASRKAVDVIVALAAIAIVVAPAVVTAPVATTRSQVPLYRQVQALCAAIGAHGAVVEVDRPAQNGYGQTMRSYCGVPSIGLIGATRGQLATMSTTAASHNRRLFVMSQHPWRNRVAPGTKIVPLSAVTAQRWPNAIGGPPRNRATLRTVVYLARVRADGQLVPVPPRQ